MSRSRLLLLRRRLLFFSFNSFWLNYYKFVGWFSSYFSCSKAHYFSLYFDLDFTWHKFDKTEKKRWRIQFIPRQTEIKFLLIEKLLKFKCVIYMKAFLGKRLNFLFIFAVQLNLKREEVFCKTCVTFLQFQSKTDIKLF